MAKTKTLVLIYPKLNQDPSLDIVRATDEQKYVYEVKRVKNSVEFAPRQTLAKQQVDTLCASREWDVTIEPS